MPVYRTPPQLLLSILIEVGKSPQKNAYILKEFGYVVEGACLFFYGVQAYNVQLDNTVNLKLIV